jgi:hypothetical protein
LCRVIALALGDLRSFSLKWSFLGFCLAFDHLFEFLFRFFSFSLFSELITCVCCQCTHQGGDWGPEHLRTGGWSLLAVMSDWQHGVDWLLAKYCRCRLQLDLRWLRERMTTTSRDPSSFGFPIFPRISVGLAWELHGEILREGWMLRRQSRPCMNLSLLYRRFGIVIFVGLFGASLVFSFSGWFRGFERVFFEFLWGDHGWVPCASLWMILTLKRWNHLDSMVFGWSSLSLVEFMWSAIPDVLGS